MKRGRPENESGAPPSKKANTGGPSPTPAGPPPGAPGGAMPKVQDALGYLEKVKNRFAAQPMVYNQFLDIMKDFKSQAIDTEGVIKRVKTLFKGNRSLILGFNQFLPPGYKIELEAEPKPTSMKPTIEFNHAVQYVAKIKHRFRDQPEIYAEFLDILHDYQAKRTIDEVYQRVQKLFGAQPDLLDEFKYFLPDNNAPPPTGGAPPAANNAPPPAPVQPTREQPKRIKPPPKQKKKNLNQPQEPVKRPKVAIQPPSQPPGRRPGKEKEIRSTKTQQGAERIITYPAGTEKELGLLEKMKQSLTRPQWLQFIKCLNLFAADVITRPELIRFIEDILHEKSGQQEWIDKFKVAIGYDEWEEKQMLTLQQTNYYAFVSSVDFATCTQVTPSYRELPAGVEIPPCSGRTELCDEVLNDRCISIPTGSEDFSFKSTRKNIYEENLFKCEDERFELDMVIENNASAIRVLEPIVEQVKLMSPEQAKRVRLHDQLDILHIRSIARIYGDQGYEVIDLLQKSPATAAPVILARLMQKDEEWRRVRLEMKNAWRKVNEQNYQRSLDHRSFYFKQEDKKRRSPKALVAELREVHQQVFHPKEDDTMDLMESENSLLRQNKQSPLYTYCMRFKYGDNEIHAQIYEILTRTAANMNLDAVKLHTFFSGFVHHMFGITLSEQQRAAATALAAQIERHQAEIAMNEMSRGTMEKDEDSDGGMDGEDEEKRRQRKVETEEVKKKQRKPRKPRGTGAMREEGDEAVDDRSGDEPEPDAMVEDETIQDASRSSTIVPSMATISARISADAAGVYPHAPATGNIKPLRVMMETWALEETINPVRRHTRPSKLFFGSNSFYVFFRLHQFLYDRLATAKQLAFKHRKMSSKKRNVPITGEERYARFCSLLTDLLENKMDSNKFEDECRNLLGASAYVLFTIDKLISQLVKQTLAILANETCMKLLALYQYEYSRSNPRDQKRTLERSAQLVRMYHSNCAALIGEDNCCQIEFFEDTHELGIGLIEGVSMAEPKNITEDWSSYLDKYLQSNNKIFKVTGRTTPFLIRNLRTFLSRLKSNTDMMQNVTYQNGLEARICLRTYKVHYVEDSEDIFIRHQPIKSEAKSRIAAWKKKQSQARFQRLDTWLNNKLTSLKTPDLATPAWVKDKTPPAIKIENTVVDTLAAAVRDAVREQVKGEGVAPMDMTGSGPSTTV